MPGKTLGSNKVAFSSTVLVTLGWNGFMQLLTKTGILLLSGFLLLGCSDPEEAMLRLMKEITEIAETRIGDCPAQAALLESFLDSHSEEIAAAQTLRAGKSPQERKVLESKYGARRDALTRRTVKAIQPCAQDPRIAAALRRL